jgi:hypothetical protein
MARPNTLDELLGRLADVHVAAATDADLVAVKARHRRRVRRRGTVALAAVALLGAVAWQVSGDDDPKVVTHPGPSTPTTPSTATEVTGEPGSVVLSPPGPYRDGQQVEVHLIGFDPADASNDAPRLCATVDRLETCDPMWQATFGRIELGQMTFTAAGWKDCGQPGVTCRIVVHGSDGRYHESDLLIFDGEPDPVPIQLSATSPEPSGLILDTAILQPRGLVADSSWLDQAEEVPDDLSAFVVQVCTFAGREGHDCNLLHYGRDIDPENPDEPIELPTPRDVFTYNGWRDCLTEPCFVLIGATEVQSVSRDATYASDYPVAAAPLRFSPSAPNSGRPTLAIVGSTSRYRTGDKLTVRVQNLSVGAGETFDLAICHQNPTRSNDCGYLTPLDPVDTQQVEVTLAPLGWPADACRAGECFLAVMIGQEGAPPLAQVPIDLQR